MVAVLEALAVACGLGIGLYVGANSVSAPRPGSFAGSRSATGKGSRGTSHHAAPRHAAPRPAAPPHHAARHPAAPPPGPLGISGSWRLTLNAQFTGGHYDGGLWRAGWFGTGVTAPINAEEIACYSSANVVPSRKGLALNVTTAQSTCDGRSQPFTGSVISTNPRDGRASGGYSFRYGVVQARVYIPGSSRMLYDWPAISTYGQHWPQDGEDDLLEVQNGVACFHFHSVGYAPGGGLGGCDPNLTAGWHTVASDWEPGSVNYYLDGAWIGAIHTGITDQPMYIAINNTVGPGGGGVSRADTVLVAYVRVWQRR